MAISLTNVINQVLHHAIFHKENKISFNSIKHNLVSQDLEPLKKVHRLFYVFEDNNIKIQPKFTICRHYLEPNGCIKTNCKFIHLCPNELNNAFTGCLNESCVYSHTLNTSHNRLVLQYEGLSDDIDLDLLLAVMKKSPSDADRQKSNKKRRDNLKKQDNLCNKQPKEDNKISLSVNNNSVTKISLEKLSDDAIQKSKSGIGITNDSNQVRETLIFENRVNVNKNINNSKKPQNLNKSNNNSRRNSIQSDDSIKPTIYRMNTHKNPPNAKLPSVSNTGIPSNIQTNQREEQNSSSTKNKLEQSNEQQNSKNSRPHRRRTRGHANQNQQKSSNNQENSKIQVQEGQLGSKIEENTNKSDNVNKPNYKEIQVHRKFDLIMKNNELRKELFKKMRSINTRAEYRSSWLRLKCIINDKDPDYEEHTLKWTKSVVSSARSILDEYIFIEFQISDTNHESIIKESINLVNNIEYSVDQSKGLITIVGHKQNITEFQNQLQKNQTNNFNEKQQQSAQSTSNHEGQSTLQKQDLPKSILSNQTTLTHSLPSQKKEELPKYAQSNQTSITQSLSAPEKQEIPKQVPSNQASFIPSSIPTQQKTRIMRTVKLAQNELRFLKLIQKDFESKLRVHFQDFDLEITDTELLLTNFPSYFDCIIKQELKKKKESSFEYTQMPGFNRLFSETNAEFQNEVEKLKTSKKTFISFSIVDNVKQIQQNHHLNITNNTIKIYQSTITVEIGDILQFNADIIVNSTSPSLRLDSGSLSKQLYKIAGEVVQRECSLKYPNGISMGQIAFTSSGNLRNFKLVYHVTVETFSSYNKDNLVQKLKLTIKNALEEMKNHKCVSICLPAIGAGGFGYPSELVAETMFNTATEFLTNNPTSSFQVKFVIYNGDPISVKAFQDTLSTQQVSIKPSVKSINKKAVFSIIGENDSSVNETLISLKQLIDERITTYTVTSDHFQHMTRDKLKKFLRVDDGVEIDLSQNGDIIIKGFKNDVQQAKDEITSEILKTNVEFQSKLLKIDPKTRWEHKNDSNDWFSFSLLLNGLIEVSFQEGIRHFEIQFDAQKIGIIDLNEVVMHLNGKKYKLRRLDADHTASSFSSFLKWFGSNKQQQLPILVPASSEIIKDTLPKEWSKMGTKELFKLEGVNITSEEYRKVVYGFTTSFGRILKVERIQNPRLYQQYEIHREYLKKKNGNENERILYHGTSSTNIDSICKFGFNRSYCGVNGVAYGKGVYFAVNSSYSHSYTKSDIYSKRYMFQCRVLIGDSIRGDSSMNVPPNKPNDEPYDSTCDSSQTLFVCYNDNQCYPEYLITYT